MERGRPGEGERGRRGEGEKGRGHLFLRVAQRCSSLNFHYVLDLVHAFERYGSGPHHTSGTCVRACDRRYYKTIRLGTSPLKLQQVRYLGTHRVTIPTIPRAIHHTSDTTSTMIQSGSHFCAGDGADRAADAGVGRRRLQPHVEELLVSRRFPLTPHQNGLVTPELQ